MAAERSSTRNAASCSTPGSSSPPTRRTPSTSAAVWRRTQRTRTIDGNPWWEMEVGVPLPQPGTKERSWTIVGAEDCPPDRGCAGIVERGAGAAHECVLYHDGTVWCRGSNRNWQLGYKTGKKDKWEDLPWRAVPGITDATQLAAEGHQTCVIRSGGELWCWGGIPYYSLVEHGDDCPGDRVGMDRLGPHEYALPQQVEAPLAVDVGVAIHYFGSSRWRASSCLLPTTWSMPLAIAARESLRTTRCVSSDEPSDPQPVGRRSPAAALGFRLRREANATSAPTASIRGAGATTATL